MKDSRNLKHLDDAANRVVVYYKDKWHKRDVPILKSFDHASWLSGVVFDGARYFNRTMPDIIAHMTRAIKSAKAVNLDPNITSDELVELAKEGVKFFPKKAELYIKPMFWCTKGIAIDNNPNDTHFSFSLASIPLQPPGELTACFTDRIKPLPLSDTVDAKASCLYPNSGIAQRIARSLGFDDAIMLDILGNVCEFTSSNLFMIKDDTVYTPIPSLMFLSGVTRGRVITLCKDNEIRIIEKEISPEFLKEADELFMTGNLNKVLPVTKLEDNDLGIGPLSTTIRDLYFDWAAKLPKIH